MKAAHPLLLAIAKETISFQDGKLGLELENFIIDARRKYSTSKEFIDSKTSGQISEIIKKHTKMLVAVVIDYKPAKGSIGPTIFLPALTSNHVFFDNYFKPHKNVNEKFVDLIKAVKGENGVNLKTSEVFGVFAYIQVTMLMNADFIIDKFQTPEEVTAIILHETGHLFTYFEYMSRTVTTNQVLASLCVDLAKDDSNAEKQNILQSAAKALSIKSELDADILQETDPRKMVIKLMRSYWIESEAGSDKYDQSSCETLADQFATRHGYGLPLVTALGKINTESISASKAGRAAMYISETLIASAATTAAAINTGIIVAALSSTVLGLLAGVTSFAVIALVWTISSTTANRFYTYDPFPTRLKKVREQIVQATRQPAITKQKIKELLEQIEAIDTLIKYSVDKKFLLNTISDFIRPFNKGPAANIALNRRLEELATNDLFIGAAKLKTLL